MVVEWDPALALGHAEIDGQHQEIFRRYAALVDAMESGRSAEIGDLFGFLVEYAARHFAAAASASARQQYASCAAVRAGACRGLSDAWSARSSRCCRRVSCALAWRTTAREGVP